MFQKVIFSLLGLLVFENFSWYQDCGEYLPYIKPEKPGYYNAVGIVSATGDPDKDRVRADTEARRRLAESIRVELRSITYDSLGYTMKEGIENISIRTILVTETFVKDVIWESDIVCQDYNPGKNEYWAYVSGDNYNLPSTTIIIPYYSSLVTTHAGANGRSP